MTPEATARSHIFSYRSVYFGEKLSPEAVARSLSHWIQAAFRIAPSQHYFFILAAPAALSNNGDRYKPS
jgi:hypothetical protein